MGVWIGRLLARGKLGLSRAPRTRAASGWRRRVESYPRGRVFAFWEGESAKEPVQHRHLTPDDLLREDFTFVEGELSAFVPSKAGV